MNELLRLVNVIIIFVLLIFIMKSLISIVAVIQYSTGIQYNTDLNTSIQHQVLVMAQCPLNATATSAHVVLFNRTLFTIFYRVSTQEQYLLQCLLFRFISRLGEFLRPKCCKYCWVILCSVLFLLLK